MNCNEFITNLEDPDLQEGGDWSVELLAHAKICTRCREVLDIFQSIRGEVATLPRRTRLVDTDSSILLSVHEAIPQVAPSRTSSPLYRAMFVATSAALAAILVLLVPAPLGSAANAAAEVQADAPAPISTENEPDPQAPAPLPPPES